MGSQRVERVGRQVLKEISTIVECDLADPRLEMLTFTSVRMSADLKSALIFYSCLDGSAGQAQCQAGLEQAIGALRRELGRRLQLRYTPALRFEFDDSVERAQRISELLARERDEK
jgi:ribosome-binding factor A